MYPIYPLPLATPLEPTPHTLSVLLSKYRGTTGSPSCACEVEHYLVVLRLCLFCDYRNSGSAAQANNNFPQLFSDFS